MISAISTAFAGMQGASRQFEQSAARIASGPAASDDTLAAVVDTMAAETSLALNTAVLRTALDLQKQVVDILV
jgi:hypothetical protein